MSDRSSVCFRYVWCLDFKGGLFCSTLPETGLNWQRFEGNVHQVAVSPSGELLMSHMTRPLQFVKTCYAHLYIQVYVQVYVALAGC